MNNDDGAFWLSPHTEKVRKCNAHVVSDFVTYFFSSNFVRLDLFHSRMRPNENIFSNTE